MRLIPALFFAMVFSTHIYGQVITGKIIHELNKEPIEYASIGIIDIPIGTTTDGIGFFSLDVRNQPVENKVRISMIGYESKTFTIEELLIEDNIISLEERYYEISEVVVRPDGKPRKVGTTKITRVGGVCGWGGTQFGAGHEIGTLIDLGDKPVKLISLHLRLYRQSFDSTLLRLHIRDLKNNFPANQLLKENIYVTISDESGWIEVDISNYNIFLNGEIALTLEWLNVFGVNENRLVKMNRSKEASAVVLFNVGKRGGLTYVRKGSEAKWSVNDNLSPGFYLTIIG